MIYLLLAAFVCGLAWLAFWSAADRPGDDFGAALPAIFFGMVTAILVVIYLFLVFWNHRFF